MSSIDIQYVLTDRGNVITQLATRDEFIACWKPVAQDLGLKWIPIFEFGIMLEAEDLRPVIEDTEVLYRFIAGDDMREKIPRCALTTTQVKTLLEILRKLLTEDFQELYIG